MVKNFTQKFGIFHRVNMCLCWEAAYLGCWIESELIWLVGKIFPRWEKEKNEEEEQNIILDHETWKNKNENNKKKGK